MDQQDAAQDDLTGTDRLIENTEKGDDGADLELEQPPQDPNWIPVTIDVDSSAADQALADVVTRAHDLAKRQAER